RKPMAGIDLLTMLARHFRAAQGLVRARVARNPNEVIEERLTFGDRLADAVARFGGSWAFIITFSIVLVTYAGLNVALVERAWDPYPFILLNLFLSMLAAMQAPVIMMSQNRQDAKDRLRGELDFAVNRKAESEIIELAAKLNCIHERLDDIHSDVHALQRLPTWAGPASRCRSADTDRFGSPPSAARMGSHFFQYGPALRGDDRRVPLQSIARRTARHADCQRSLHGR